MKNKLKGILGFVGFLLSLFGISWLLENMALHNTKYEWLEFPIIFLVFIFMGIFLGLIVYYVIWKYSKD